jgi:hypothetical protein
MCFLCVAFYFCHPRSDIQKHNKSTSNKKLITYNLPFSENYQYYCTPNKIANQFRKPFDG